VFTAILSRIWVRVIDNTDALIKPKTKQLTLPVSARQASILRSSLEVCTRARKELRWRIGNLRGCRMLQRLHDYFYAGGDGIKTAKLDTEVAHSASKNTAHEKETISSKAEHE
jgi:hypothetical protein